MPSLVISTIDDAPPPKPRPKRWPWAVATLLVAIPLAITMAGRFTAPPVVMALPTGRLVYMDADAPSEKTTTLRGMRLVTLDGASREMLREVEPQDTDGGSRDWINQPAFSPDGRQIAYIKQVITIVEGTHDIVHQLWLAPADTGTHGGGKPRLLLDLSKSNMKPPSGLAWSADGKSVVFLNDGTIYSLPIAGGAPTVTALSLPPSATAANGASTTSDPTVGPMGLRAFLAHTKSSADLNIIDAAESKNSISYSTISNVAAYTLGDHDNQLAYVTKGRPMDIQLNDVPMRGPSRAIHVNPGWSIFGGRKITSLRWSPDGKCVAYTVSKPPVPEDELFCLDIATGKSVKLPMRVGRAGWDWGVAP
jgi:WD40 repeat protein